MKRPLRLLSALVILSFLAGCGKFTLNPFKWFAKREQAAVLTLAAPVDPRPLIATIVSMRIEQVPTGILITATGRGAAQGSWQADLVPKLPVENGKLILEFRANMAPLTGAGMAVEGSARSREVTTGLHIRRDEVAGLRSITVQGADNGKTARP